MNRVAVSRPVLEAAIAWRLQLDAGEADAAAHAHWLQANPEHRRVWRQLQALDESLAHVGPQGRRALLRAGRSSLAAVGKALLVLLLLTGLLLPLAQDRWPLRHALADQLTATAEVRSLVLDDRSEIQLDARSALDIEFGAQQRRLHLHAGQVLVQTAHGDPRPFVVVTEHGELLALGTRFVVSRRDADGTRLTVLESAVEARDGDGSTHRVEAGQSLWLRADGTAAIAPAAPGADAWTRGMLAVEGARLGEIIERLGDYSHRPVTLDTGIENLRVTGSFPLRDLDTALAALTSTLPVKESRLAGWWIRLEPRQP